MSASQAVRLLLGSAHNLANEGLRKGMELLGRISRKKGLQHVVLNTTVWIKPLGTHNYSRQFLTVARAAKLINDVPLVTPYLYCHSLELSLKAYLMIVGCDEKCLLDLRHDLETILDCATELGIENIVSISANERSEIRTANAYYHKKQFEYVKPCVVTSALMGYPDLPDIQILDGLAARMVDALEDHCISASQ